MNFRIEDNEEGRQVELPALELITALGYTYIPNYELNIPKERPDHRQVLLYPRLRAAIKRLNDFDDDGIEQAIAQIHEDNFPIGMPMIDANEKIRIKLTGRAGENAIAQPITIKQYGKKGIEYPTVKFFDFDPKKIGTKEDKNEYLVTNQFKHLGNRTEIECDIVIFVNGIPLVLIECKKPTTIDLMKTVWKENLEKYQRDGSHSLGHEKLFFFNHVIMATSAIQARYGTLKALPNKYAKWTSLTNITTKELEKLVGRKPTPQDIMLAGMIKKETLLDMLKNFVLYEIEEHKKIKKVAKHQQYRVVTKSVDRISHHKKVEDKGGVIWHTQGSGKSLSMVWFATQLYYKFSRPTIMVITDRRQLNKQIFDTFRNCGFPEPEKPRNRSQLAKTLQYSKGKTIMVNLQKFDKPEKFVETKEKIYVLVDEAHRSQYKWTAGYMRKAMPNAVFFAFTGTPLDRENKNTYRRFGPLIDKYSFTESKEDGATVKVEHMGLLPEIEIEGGNSLNNIFDNLFGHLPKAQQAEIRRKYATKKKIASSPARIRKICEKIVDHYTKKILPNGYKAMIVAPTRAAAVTYKRELEDLTKLPARIIMDSKKDEVGPDEFSWADYYLPQNEALKKAEEFTNPDDPTKFLIVVDMLLVGYDAPIVQVMYLDRPLREHALLQAIARVNRIYDEHKDRGFIIDFWGVTRDLQNALKMFEEQDVQGALDNVDDDLLELDVRHKDFMEKIQGIDSKDHNEIAKRFEDEDEQEEFEYAFKRFAKALEAVLPDKEAVPYEKDLKKGYEIRGKIRAWFYGDRADLSEYGKKVQKIIDKHIRAIGISEISGSKEITYDNFLGFIAKFKGDNRAKAALIKKRATLVIREMSPDNPAFYQKLKERLEKLIQDEKERRVDDAQYFEGIRDIFEEALSGPEKLQKQTGIKDRFQLAIYMLLEEKHSDLKQNKKYSEEIFKKVKKAASVKDWRDKEPQENEIELAVIDTLDKKIFDEKTRDKLASEVYKMAVNNNEW
ncbi:type I restriction endonuclease subunit R [Nitrosopumilus maritimus]|uniref:type I site-specific deoxyribonuclease n=1 Tax=Nitrosopumilus maritimus (strain SCM1) TaxID=436308 RepID=A9A375_NITMS|nr:HsdR family type I site-specific deoxyribonuclease [Nitrosopumilus maritimus]ABX12504.1 type I site-specific deoxyribonuclease, HsdR family [Nitrosopumilus maritimus SCM1]